MKHVRLIVAGLLAIAAPLSAHAQIPVASLNAPPATARHFIISSTGGKHGDSWIWTGPDGATFGRESHNLRGQDFEIDSVGRQGPDGMPTSLVIRGVTPSGDAAETFSLANGKATWKSQIDSGSIEPKAAAFYTSQGGPAATNAWLIERLLAAPDKSLTLLPGGQLRAEKLTSVEIGAGAAKKTVTAWALVGLSTSPIPVWADQDGKFFGLSFGLSWLPEGYESERGALEKAQTAALGARMPALAKSLVTVPKTAVAFTNVKLFDADAVKFTPNQTVVVVDGKIKTVGRAGKVKIPKGAQIIDGKGKTLIPGLWDCHMHVGDDYTGLQELSLGVTSVRDPGNDDEQTLNRRARAAKGDLLFPNVYPSSLIDGKGPFTAQVANVATSEAEAIALVRRAKTNGFNGVKFYGTFNPAWLKASIGAAHELGLHVHGHVPAGIRPMDAINAGYDEITHINWVIMQAMPDSVIAVSNGFARFEGPGRYAKDISLDAEPMKSMKAGAPIVAGTDGSGLEIVRELEIYVEAGLTPAQALTTATINAARLVGQDKVTGSIKAGKVADLVLIEGDPEANVAALRQTRVVMLGGKLLDADALRTAAGFSGRPR